METPENPYQHASRTATIRATVTTAGVRCTKPMERNGRNHTAVPTKKQTKKSSAADKCSSCAARTPATRNGGQRLIPSQKSQRQRTRPHAAAAARRSAPARPSPLAAPKLERWRGSPQRISGAASPPRKPPVRRPAATGSRPSTTSARSMRAESTTPPSKPPPRTPCTQPAAPPETTAAAGCATALPAAEPSSTAPPPARRSPGKPAPSRVPAQAPPRRWPKEKVPPSCLKSRSVREIPFVTVVTPPCAKNRRSGTPAPRLVSRRRSLRIACAPPLARSV